MDALREFFRKNKLLVQSVALVAAFFGFDGWKTLQEVGAVVRTHFNVPGTLLSLHWWTSSVVGVPFARIFLLVIVVGIIVNAIFTIRNRNRPLTVLCTEITLQFRDGGKDVITKRKQLMHANRPGIKAYFIKVTHDAPNGRFKPDPVSGNELMAWIENPEDLKITPRMTGTRAVRDIDLVYSSPLPYGWIITLIPRWFLEWGPEKLPERIAKYLVVQRVLYTSVDEYDGDYAKIGVSCTRYSHQRVTIELDFSNDTGLKPTSAADVTVFRRLANALSEETALPTDTPGIYRVIVNAGLAKDESLVVTWKRH